MSSRALGILWIGHWVLVLVVTHAPVTVSPAIVRRGEDKLIHFLLYFFLAMLGGWRVLRRSVPGVEGRLIGWAAVYMVFAALDEWTQRFVGRTPSVYDWLADACGVILATVFLMARRRRLVEPTVSAGVGKDRL